MQKKKYLCPICNKKLVDIIYGMPCSDKLIIKAQNKEIYLGGCVIESNIPLFHCYNCDKNFNIEKLESKK